ncbi:MAG: hypothetical protein NVS4B1_15970 [Ktedonobacteraceae bacterium]
MKVVFRSKDFVSVTAVGLGFNNRRPMADAWHYQGRVQHRDWQGTYECYWEGGADTAHHSPTELVWTVRGDARLFRLAATLKSLGFTVDVLQDEAK